MTHKNLPVELKLDTAIAKKLHDEVICEFIMAHRTEGGGQMAGLLLSVEPAGKG